MIKSDKIQTSNNNFDYKQSMNQSFYFIENINLNDIVINDFDILSYCNGNLAGSRTWSGSYTDVPVMGNDGNEYSAGYCIDGQRPEFKLYDSINSKTYSLEGNYESWNNNGIFTINELELVIDVPDGFELMEPYPNPFNPSTRISYYIASDSFVSLEVIDISGRLVETLINNSRYSKGQYFIDWNAQEYTSGLYFVRMVANNNRYTKKILLVK